MADAWTKRARDVALGLLALIALVLTGWALKAAYPVLMPLAFGVAVAALVQPVRRGVSSKLPDRFDWVGVSAAMLTVVLALAAFVGVGWLAVEVVGDQAPRYADRLQQQWQALESWARANNLPLPRSGDGQGGNGTGGLVERLAGLAAAVVGSAGQAVVYLVLIFFFALLLLIEVETWKRKARQVFARSRAAATVDIADATAKQTRSYLYVRTMVSAISAALTLGWLLITGVDFAFLWAFVVFAFNFVPNVGSIASGASISLFAFVQFGPAWALLVAGGLFAIEQTIGNYVDPRLQGRALDISPVVVLLAVIFWGWAWGAAGALLAVPLTAALIVACAHVHALRPVALLLSRGSDEAALMDKTHKRERDRPEA